MKILLATFWHVPHVGGVWNYMQQLKEKLELLGHEVDLLGYGENDQYIHIPNQKKTVRRELFTKQIEEKFPTTYIDEVVNYYERRKYFYQLGSHYLGLEHYDLIHTQDVVSTVGINQVKQKNTVLVATLHGSVAHEIKEAHYNPKKTFVSNRGSLYFDELEYNGATAAEYTIVANEWLKKVLTHEFHVPDEQLKVMHYGYDIESFLQRMKKKSVIHSPNDKHVIIYTGRLSEFKGVHHLISALSQLKKVRNDWVCWIVGDGPRREELQRQSKVLGLEQEVFFLGRREDVPYLLSLSDVFVLPTLIDNQPLSIIEAQIAGTAVIASEVGGVPEMIEHGMTGVLSPPGDEQMLAIKIGYLLEHEAYRKNLGARAQKWALNHWSPDRAVQRVLDIYAQAITKSYNK